MHEIKQYYFFLIILINFVYHNYSYSPVHGQLALLQLHLSPQENFINSKQALLAIGNVVHRGSQHWLSAFHSHPDSPGSGLLLNLFISIPYTSLIIITRLQCCKRFGGRFSIDLLLWQNNDAILASSTCSRSLLLLYITTVNHSKSLKYRLSQSVIV